MAWTVRRGYWYVCFFGFACNYMIRVNLNIAITAMVAPGGGNNLTVRSECIAPREELGEALALGDEGTATAMRLYASGTSPVNETRQQDGDGFAWDSNRQNLVLGSFFWLHWATQIPGGILARSLGTKLVFGLSNLAMFLISFALPAAAYWDYKAVAALRIVQGVIGGLAWPSMHHLVAHWIPPTERSQFITSYLGSSFGVALLPSVRGGH